MRKDVYVQNDSGGLSLTAASFAPNIIEDDRNNDEMFVLNHQAILMQLVGDDSFIARVVQDEELTQAEEQEWIAKVQARLHVPCGKLLIAGGFDPRCFDDYCSEREVKEVQEVAILPGTYLVDIYTYLSTMNGRVFRHTQWPQPALGDWFRQDHPGTPFPSWIAAELIRFPQEDDPNHMEDWKNLEQSSQDGRIAIDLQTLDWVGFLIHLRPDNADAKLSVPIEDGWLAENEGLRRPVICPQGIPSEAKEPSVRYILGRLLK